MADETESLLPEYMKRFDAHLKAFDSKLVRFSDDFHNVKIRLSAVEEGRAGVNRRLDRADMRLDHIEKRLELVGPLQPGFRE